MVLPNAHHRVHRTDVGDSQPNHPPLSRPPSSSKPGWSTNLDRRYGYPDVASTNTPSQRPESDNIGGATKGITESAKGLLGVDKQKEEWKKAQAYEERRAAEEKEKAFRRMEDLRRKQAEKGGL